MWNYFFLSDEPVSVFTFERLDLPGILFYTQSRVHYLFLAELLKFNSLVACISVSPVVVNTLWMKTWILGSVSSGRTCDVNIYQIKDERRCSHFYTSAVKHWCLWVSSWPCWADERATWISKFVNAMTWESGAVWV